MNNAKSISHDCVKEHIGKEVFACFPNELFRTKIIGVTSLGNIILEDWTEIVCYAIRTGEIRIYPIDEEENSIS